MKPKIELNREYPTRGGGVGIVHFVDSDGRLIGRIKRLGDSDWLPTSWHSDGRQFANIDNQNDLLLPRVVMVPITVPEWARSVRVYGDETIIFSAQPATEEWHLSVEDWIASLE